MQLHKAPSLILSNSHNKNAYSVHYANPCQPLEHLNLRKLANAGAHRASKHPPHQSYSELTPRAHRASKHPPHLNTLHIRANTEDCSGQLRDCNPNPPSAKPTSAMAVENAAIRRSYSKPPYGVKKIAAQPGQTTNDKSTCERKGGGKEQASTKQKGSPRHFVTYPAASALKRSTCRGSEVLRT